MMGGQRSYGNNWGRLAKPVCSDVYVRVYVCVCARAHAHVCPGTSE